MRKEFTRFQIKSAIFNAYCELSEDGTSLTVEDARRFGKAVQIVTGQDHWYGFVTKMLRDGFPEGWTRQSVGFRLGKGIAGMYRKMVN